MSGHMGQGLRGLRRNRRGAVAAEFALITPLLFSLILGALEYSVVFLSYSSMQFTANAVAREVAVNNLNVADAAAKIKAALPGWFANSVTVVVSESNPGAPQNNVVKVLVTAQADAITPLSVFTTSYPWTLTAEVLMDQELPYED